MLTKRRIPKGRNTADAKREKKTSEEGTSEEREKIYFSGDRRKEERLMIGIINKKSKYHIWSVVLGSSELRGGVLQCRVGLYSRNPDRNREAAYRTSTSN